MSTQADHENGQASRPCRAVTAPSAAPAAARAAHGAHETRAEKDELVLDDLLVEDVSIDGMCGVY
jgi:mycofactocin precursor